MRVIRDMIQNDYSLHKPCLLRAGWSTLILISPGERVENVGLSKRTDVGGCKQHAYQQIGGVHVSWRASSAKQLV